ncbi:hypothetical protein ACFL54_09205 [Planctomycetota bacterium]
MDTDQFNEEAPEITETAEEEKMPSCQSPLLGFVKLMGKTAGLAKKAGTKTAADIVNAPSKLCHIASRGAKKGRDLEIERIHASLFDLYTRIGERVCQLAKVDVTTLQDDLQLKAMVLSAIELGEKMETATQDSDGDTADAETSTGEETPDAGEQEHDSEDEQDNQDGSEAAGEEEDMADGPADEATPETE